MTDRSPRITTAGVVLALLAAASLTVIGLTPLQWLQPLAAFIRRADDLTPDRYARFQHVCWLGAFVLAIAAVCLRGFWEQIACFLKELYTDPLVNINERRESAAVYVCLGIILLTGCGLRLANLDNAMAYDEAYTYLNFARRPWYEAIGDYNSTNNHLLNTLLVHISTRIFGPEEWAIRLPVFVVGCGLVLAVFVWVRDWLGSAAGLAASALTAVSPMLVIYSVDARGYMYVALATVVLDATLARIRNASSPRRWLVAFAAMVFGLCAMPIMVYGVVACLGWYVLLPAEPSEKLPGVRRRSLNAVLLLALSAVAVGIFYTPAYIFRGLMFLRDPIMQSEMMDTFLMRLAAGWRDAWFRFTEGGVPWWLWMLATAAGAWALRGRGKFWLRWGALPITVLALNVVQQVAPPARVYLLLVPWLYLLAGSGMLWIVERARLSPRWSSFAVAAAICVTGLLHAWRQPVLFFPEDRLGYVSVPEVVERLKQEVSNSDDAGVLLAPLPLDLPAIFYMDRTGFRVSHNEEPRLGQRVWLIARHGETPNDVLADTLIRLAEQADRFAPWRQVAEFETLTLYESTFE